MTGSIAAGGGLIYCLSCSSQDSSLAHNRTVQNIDISERKPAQNWSWKTARFEDGFYFASRAFRRDSDVGQRGRGLPKRGTPGIRGAMLREDLG